MANELTLEASLGYTKNATSITMSLGATQFTVAGSICVRALQAIANTATALGIGGMTTCGYCLMVNRDNTNSVNVRMGNTGADVATLKAGEFAMFRLASNTPYLITNAGTVNVEYALIEA